MPEALRAQLHSAGATCAAVIVILVACSTLIVVIAQSEKVATAEDLDRLMKKAQPAMRAAQKAISGNAYADAKVEVATLRQAIFDSQQFWVEKKRDDALKMNRETIEKIDTLDKALSAETVDSSAAMAALKEVGGSCRICHEKYRATDSENNYIIKPGSLEDQ